MITALNGHLPASELVTVGSILLRRGPAAALVAAQHECQRRFGWTPQATSGYRPIDEQIALFRARYTQQNTGNGPYGDVRYWQGARFVRTSSAGSAAVPGSSNHGLGIAGDIAGLGAAHSTRWSQWALVAQPLGWSWTEGATVDEPWHWVNTGPADTVSNVVSQILGSIPAAPTAPVPTPPTPLLQEDDMSMPSFARRNDGLIVALTGRGAHRLTAAEWAVWTNLGLGVFPPGMSAMDPGPFQDVVNTVGGWTEDATPSASALAAAIAAQLPQADAATIAALIVSSLPAGATAPTAQQIADELAKRLAQ